MDAVTRHRLYEIQCGSVGCRCDEASTLLIVHVPTARLALTSRARAGRQADEARQVPRGPGGDDLEQAGDGEGCSGGPAQLPLPACTEPRPPRHIHRLLPPLLQAGLRPRDTWAGGCEDRGLQVGQEGQDKGSRFKEIGMGVRLAGGA